MKTKYKIYMIANSHIDPVWLWRRSEGYWVTRQTVRNAIKLMEKYSDFTFLFSSAALYKWIEESEPELFNKIKKYIRENRWVIVGGWIVEPDCNLPSGESFVRHALYGKKYFREKFGVDVKIGYNIDSFGHNAMLPQILKKCGIEFYVIMRPNPREKELPLYVFWWEAPDGSRVLTYRLPFSYALHGERLSEHLRKYVEEAKKGVGVIMCLYGRGDHGGGPSEADIEIIRRASEALKEAEIVFGTPQEFFNEVLSRAAELPVVKDELQHHARGCYSAYLKIKKLNRLSEHSLIQAERIAVMSNSILGIEYPRKEFRKAWENLLFSQFHDSLAGTCIPEAYDDVEDMCYYSLNIAKQTIERAIHAIAANVDTTHNNTALIIFNPLTVPVKAPIEIEPAWPESLGVYEVSGRQIPHQYIQPHSLSGTRRAVIVAHLLPLGYKVYSLKTAKTKLESRVKVRGNIIENERFILEINPQTGCISRLFDKKYGVEVFNGDASYPLIINDPSDTWSHGVSKFEDIIGSFSNIRVTIVEKGPVRCRVRAKGYYNRSVLWQDYILYADLDFIELRLKVEWHEKQKMLKLAFPINVKEPVVSCEIPYGFIKRTCNGEEEPMQRWIDLTGKTYVNNKELKYGVTIVNDSIYSYSAVGSELRLTLLRSPIYAHHDPRKPMPGVDYKYTDQGIHYFKFLILPHYGNWKEVNVTTYAELVNSQIPYIIEDSHKGKLPKELSFISVDQRNVIVNVVKLAEDSEDIVLRLYEVHGVKTNVRITLPWIKRNIEVTVNPYEIKSLLIPLDPSRPVRECNLIED